jgi:hypothetical protein
VEYLSEIARRHSRESPKLPAKTGRVGISERRRNFFHRQLSTIQEIGRFDDAPPCEMSPEPMFRFTVQLVRHVPVGPVQAFGYRSEG